MPNHAGSDADTSDLRVLVFGANGFVGRHLTRTLRDSFADRLTLALTSRNAGTCDGEPIQNVDVTDADAVATSVADFDPTHVVNLAGLAAVAAAEANADQAWLVHVHGTLNVARAIIRNAPGCTFISVGTGQVYGMSARSGSPLREDTLLAPLSTYEVTKAAADIAVGGLCSQGLHGIRMRPFNHFGPGQTEDFVVPGFAMQIARIEAGSQAPIIRVGNLSAQRDFLDVRDVSAAYARAIAKSREIKAGTIINVASSQPVRIQTILDKLLALSRRTDIRVEQDPARMRPAETPIFVGDASRARDLLDWKPRYDLDESLLETLEDCRRRVKAAIH